METLKKKLAQLRNEAEESHDEADRQRRIAKEYKDRMEAVRRGLFISQICHFLVFVCYIRSRTCRAKSVVIS